MSESNKQNPQSISGEEVLSFQQLYYTQKFDSKLFSRLSSRPSSNHMLYMLKHHWPEYLMDAAGLGIFMVSAVVFTAILEHPSSPVRQIIVNPFLRRMLIGIAMGLTAICIIYSPWGKQSGAHINPSVTLTFFRPGKVKPWDAFFYIIAQFICGLAGVLLITAVIKEAIAHPSVNYVATIPGTSGVSVAFISEFIISFILMSIILVVSKTMSIAHLTGLFAGILVATYITLEPPLSEMRMNPARTFGSALPANIWTALWVYFTASPLGMFLGGEVYLCVKGTKSVLCAKLRHQNDKRCIRCGKPEVER
jgi:aquaporin Z